MYSEISHPLYLKCDSCPTLLVPFYLQIFAKKASGENAKESFSILDSGVTVDLPDHFCLERPENSKVR